MYFVAKEKTAPATWSVSAAISAEDFSRQLDETFKKELPKLTLPGFRKGKAPRSMVEKRYGANLFFDEALEALLPAAVTETLEEAGLELLFRPEDLDVQEIGKETGVQFTFTAICKPEVSIEGYKGIEAAVPGEEVTEADIEARIDELRQRNARQVEVTARPAQNGDIAVIDFVGLLDGEAFDGGTAENHELTLGSGQFIPGFEEQIIGRSPGEECFDVHVTFPGDYHAEELAGKPVVFEVTLHELKAEELPELDDDFAQEVGEDYNTVEDLRAGITDELVESKKQAAEEGFDHAVQDKLAELLDGEIPPAMVERRAEQNIEQNCGRFRIAREQYLEIVGEDNIRTQSEAQIRRELALEAVAEQEGFTPTSDEIEAEQQRLAEQYDVTIAQVKYSMPEEEIVKILNREKALEFVKAEAIKKVE